MLTEEIKQEIIRHADTSNNEVCGVIFYLNGQLMVQRKENLINSATEFMMKVDENKDIAAYYHSHIDFDSISQADQIVSERLGLPCVVYNKQSGSFYIYSPNGNKIQYTGRPFLLGFADCLWLVKDYYKHNLNINFIPEPEVLKTYVNKEEYNFLMTKRFTDEAEYVKDNDFLKKYFEANDFREVKDIKKNDVLIMRTKAYNFPIHCAIYIGEGKILHHPGDAISTIERLSNEYKKWVIYIMRHKLYD